MTYAAGSDRMLGQRKIAYTPPDDEQAHSNHQARPAVPVGAPRPPRGGARSGRRAFRDARLSPILDAGADYE